MALRRRQRARACRSRVPSPRENAERCVLCRSMYPPPAQGNRTVSTARRTLKRRTYLPALSGARRRGGWVVRARGGARGGARERGGRAAARHGSWRSGSGVRMHSEMRNRENTLRCMLIGPTCECAGYGTHGQRQYHVDAWLLNCASRASNARCWSTKPVRHEPRSTSCSRTTSGVCSSITAATCSIVVATSAGGTWTSRPPS